MQLLNVLSTGKVLNILPIFVLFGRAKCWEGKVVRQYPLTFSIDGKIK